MHLAWLLPVILFAFVACNKPERFLEAAKPSAQTEVNKTYAVPQDAMVLTLNTDSLAKPWLKDHSFGKFFADRAEFFVIQNSTSNIFGSPVKTIILYYLDERHCQSKFVITNNITNTLIARYGTFSITALDEPNKELLNSVPVVFQEQDKGILNPVFTHYELAWKLPDKVIRFRVKPQSEEEQYVYTEHIPDYHSFYRSVEKASL